LFMVPLCLVPALALLFFYVSIIIIIIIIIIITVVVVDSLGSLLALSANVSFCSNAHQLQILFMQAVE